MPKTKAILLLGPAFVAAIAYVDPGNVAANLTAGARYGHLLLWVLVLANAIAVLVQYSSAKLGLVTGQSLSEYLGDRLRTWPRRLYWLQAELVAAATDIAEVFGGAIALHLLFGIPLWLGGLIVGVIAIAILNVQSRAGQRAFEFVIIGLLAIIVVGFVFGLMVSGFDGGEALTGLVPRFQDTDSVLLATSMLGATVMPHAIYLHSALARDRHLAPKAGAGAGIPDEGRIPLLLRATKIDVLAALVVAGAVNIAMLLLAATALRGVAGTDSIEGAHAAIVAALGPGVAAVFAIGLLASGLASSAVGTYAGQSIIGGLLKIRVPVTVRRLITLVPAVVLLAVGVDPTWALVLSQVVLSFGIPFALIPLVHATGSVRVMGRWVHPVWLRVLGWIAVAIITALNALLIVLLALG
ncbi:MAG: Nramp family divalent metal transporter [Microbacteriaceae bacterium]|nr:Nramp family divalent metal transporter [Microbacteriaceae bacterium]